MTAKTSTRRERDRQLREDDFLAAAETLFGEKGYHETSMEDVARTAEYATGTIYRYFESKEALYNALLERKGKIFFDDLEQNVRTGLSPLEEVRELLRCELDFHFENQSFMRIYFEEIGPHKEKRAVGGMSKTLQDQYAAYMTRWRDALARGMQEGVFEKQDVDMSMAAIVGFTKQVMQLSLQETFQGNRADVESFIFDFLERALIAKRGE